MEQHGSHWTDFHEILYLSFRKSVQKLQVTLKSNKNNGYFTWRHLHTGLFISPSGISELDCATTKTDTAERSHSAGIHVPFTNCFVCRWFCVVHDPKPPLHSHNWLSFGKFQDTELFLILCERHFSSRLPPSGGIWKYAKAPSTKNLERLTYE